MGIHEKLVVSMVDRFPGLVSGANVNGADLVEWLSGQLTSLVCCPLCHQLVNPSEGEDL